MARWGPLSQTVRRVVLALAALTVLATACTPGESMTAEAVFTDVIDLTTDNAVKLADVTVGNVESIELTEDNEALVTMSLDPNLELPSRVTARLRKTNLLGERFVEIVPDESSGGQFPSGGRIEETEVIPELEEVVYAGTDLLLAVSADTLAGAIESSATGLDGRGQTLGRTLDDLTEIVSTYDETSDDLVRLVRGFEGFLAPVGPQAALHGQALAELERTFTVLEQDDDLLIDALNQTQELAIDGTDIIRTHRQRFDNGFVRFEALSEELIQPETEFDTLFVNINGHDFNTIRGVNQEFAQIILDVLVCGINDVPGDPIRACTNPGSEQAPPVPRAPQDY